MTAVYLYPEAAPLQVLIAAVNTAGLQEQLFQILPSKNWYLAVFKTDNPVWVSASMQDSLKSVLGIRSS